MSSEEVELSVTTSAKITVELLPGGALVRVYVCKAVTTDTLEVLAEVLRRWLEHHKTAIIFSKAPGCREDLVPQMPAMLNLAARLLEHRALLEAQVPAVCVLADALHESTLQAEQWFRGMCHPTFDLLVTADAAEAHAFARAPVLTCS